MPLMNSPIVCIVGDKLCYEVKGMLRLVLRNRSDIEAALTECHDSEGNGGHRGVTVTLKKLDVTYYWGTMAADVREWVCEAIEIDI